MIGNKKTIARNTSSSNLERTSMYSNLSRTAALATALALAPLGAQAVTTSGFFNSAASPVFAGDFAQGGAIATANEDFGNVTGTLTAGENLKAFLTATINPFLTSATGGGFSNSISMSYQINGGSMVGLPITATNMTGSTQPASFSLLKNDTVSFIISGLAGISGNDTNYNVVFSPGTISAVPIPAGAAMLLTGLVGLFGFRRFNLGT